jgi:replicative DNA helicase
MPLNPVSFHASDSKSVLPPHNLEAEQALLAAIIGDNRAHERVAEFLKAEHFYNPVFGKIYSAIGAVLERGQRADSITLRQFFAADLEILQLGGADYLTALAGSYVSIINAAQYGNIIHDMHLRREVLRIATDLAAGALNGDPEESAGQLINTAETRLYRLAEGGPGQGGLPFATVVEKTMAKIQEGMREDADKFKVYTGIKAIDKILGGLEPGLVYLIAARPSMGKTAMGITIAFNVARAGHPVRFQSLEMPDTSLTMRILARFTGIPVSEQKRLGGDYKKHDELQDVAREISRHPLVIDEDAALNIMQVRARALRQKRKGGLKLLVIDYLSLMAPAEKKQNRNYEIEEITRGLVQIAKELEIPVLLLAQLNRQGEQREDKRPILADLRDSGAIEQDVYAAMFLFREEYYLERQEPKSPRASENQDHFELRVEKWRAQLQAMRGKAEIIFAKNRDGECGIRTVAFDGARSLFSDLDLGAV